MTSIMALIITYPLLGRGLLEVSIFLFCNISIAHLRWALSKLGVVGYIM